MRNGGGGVYIDLHRESGSIEFSNCTIYNNTAQFGEGGGVLIELHNGSGSIELSKCTIYSNTAWNGGGGVYIDSIEFSNCIIYNNTAQFGEGGGVWRRRSVHYRFGMEEEECTS